MIDAVESPSIRQEGKVLETTLGEGRHRGALE